MSLWRRIREWLLPSQPYDYGEELYVDLPGDHVPGELGHDEEVPGQIGEPVVDEDGEPVVVLGLFGGAVRQGPLYRRRIAKGVEQFLVLDDATGIYWPALPEELGHETTVRVEP